LTDITTAKMEDQINIQIVIHLYKASKRTRK